MGRSSRSLSVGSEGSDAAGSAERSPRRLPSRRSKMLSSALRRSSKALLPLLEDGESDATSRRLVEYVVVVSSVPRFPTSGGAKREALKDFPPTPPSPEEAPPVAGGTPVNSATPSATPPPPSLRKSTYPIAPTTPQTPDSVTASLPPQKSPYAKSVRIVDPQTGGITGTKTPKVTRRILARSVHLDPVLEGTANDLTLALELDPAVAEDSASSNGGDGSGVDSDSSGGSLGPGNLRKQLLAKKSARRSRRILNAKGGKNALLKSMVDAYDESNLHEELPIAPVVGEAAAMPDVGKIGDDDEEGNSGEANGSRRGLDESRTFSSDFGDPKELDRLAEAAARSSMTSAEVAASNEFNESMALKRKSFAKSALRTAASFRLPVLDEKGTELSDAVAPDVVAMGASGSSESEDNTSCGAKVEDLERGMKKVTMATVPAVEGDSPEAVPSPTLLAPPLTTNPPPATPDNEREKGANQNIHMPGADRYDNDQGPQFTFQPVVTSRYPPQDHPDNALNPMLPHFCHPHTDIIEPTTEYKMPRVHHFVLTNDRGRKMYGTCLTIYEEYKLEDEHDYLGWDGSKELDEAEEIEAIERIWSQDDSDLTTTEGTATLFHRSPQELLAVPESDSIEVTLDDGVDDSFSSGGPISTNTTAQSSTQLAQTLSKQCPLYVPRVICLLSTWPYLTAFREYLTQLYRLATGTNLMKAPLERYILNICAEIPAPPPGAFEIRLDILNSAIRFWAPPANQPIPYVALPFGTLFECLDAGNVLFAWYSLVLERKVLLISSQYSLLTVCAEILCSLLFPMQWSHLYIPVLPRFLSPMLDAPMPYLCGLSRDNLPYAIGDIGEETIVVDLDQNVITMGPKTPDLPPIPFRRRVKLETALESNAGDVFWNARGLTKARVRTMKTKMSPEEVEKELEIADKVWEGKLRNFDAAFNLAYTPDSPNLLNDEDLAALKKKARDKKKGHRRGGSSGGSFGSFGGSTTGSSFGGSGVTSPIGSQTSLGDLDPQSRWDKVQEAFLRFYVAMLKGYNKFLVIPEASLPPSDLGGGRTKSVAPTNRWSERRSFKTEEFVMSQRVDFRPFLEELTLTQQFDDFITKRLYSPDEPEVIFFDQNIDAKINRSKLRLKKKDTPILQSATAHKVLNVVHAVEPNADDLQLLPEGKKCYMYPTWPETFDLMLFGKPRPIPKMISAEFDRRAALSAQLRSKYDHFAGASSGSPEEDELWELGDCNPNPEVATFTVFFFTFTCCIGRELAELERTKVEMSGNLLDMSRDDSYDSDENVTPDKAKGLGPAPRSAFEYQESQASENREEKAVGGGSKHALNKSILPSVLQGTMQEPAADEERDENDDGGGLLLPPLPEFPSDMFSNPCPKFCEEGAPELCAGWGIEGPNRIASPVTVAGRGDDFISAVTWAGDNPSGGGGDQFEPARSPSMLSMESKAETARAIARAQLELAFNILEMLKERGLSADPDAYKCLMEACSRCGDRERASRLMEMVQEDGLVADSEMYSCFMNAFAVPDAPGAGGSGRAVGLDAVATPMPVPLGPSLSAVGVTPSKLQFDGLLELKLPKASTSFSVAPSFRNSGKRASASVKDTFNNTMLPPPASANETLTTADSTYESVMAKSVSSSTSAGTRGSGIMHDLYHSMVTTFTADGGGEGKSESQSRASHHRPKLSKSSRSLLKPTSGGKKTQKRRTSVPTKKKDLIVTDRVLTHVTLGETLLEFIYNDVAVDTSSDTCPQCSSSLTEDDIIAGWVPCKFREHTTACPQCQHRFIPRFSVTTTSEMFEGSQGKGTPLYCEFLSPWVLRKELRNVILGNEGIECLLSPEWRSKADINATLWWNVVVSFMRYKLPVTFLLQGSFKNQLIVPAVD